MPLLKAVEITKTYQLGEQEIHALNKISLSIEQGEFVSIIGKSGSGKSTLMHILGLLDTPTRGELFLNDKKVSSYSQNKLALLRNKEIGFIFQSFNLLPRTSALENVMLPLHYSNYPKKDWKDMAIEVLELVELSDRMHNKPNELSGGQKQRVAIARALVTKPSIIFADEPTGNLDSKTGDEIEKLLINLHKQGKTIVLVTHDSDLANITQRQIILLDGKIIND